MTIDSLHSELVEALNAFYTLLVDLGVFNPVDLRRPDAATGRYPVEEINVTAARAAGYSDAAVDLMYQLPYLHLDESILTTEILPNTFPTSYLGSENDEGDFESRREMLNDALMPPSAIRLTTGASGSGDIFIYDVETKLMTLWKPWDNEPDIDDYFHVPARPVREVLGPVIGRYQSLDILATPEGVDFNAVQPEPPDHLGEAWKQAWRADVAVFQAVRKLKDLYLECGWDPAADVQEGFRKDEYLERRQQYWDTVVSPLVERRDEANEVARGER